MKPNAILQAVIFLMLSVSQAFAQDNMQGTSQTFNFDVTSTDINFDISQYVKEGKYYALIIGVEDYEDKKFQKLDNPIRDSRKLTEVLQRQYTFEPENTTILKNPKREELILALQDLAKKVTPSDNVLIFYAGHGTWDEATETGYWIPSDAKNNDFATWIPNSSIREYVKQIRSRHTLLIADACFSGSIFKTRGSIASASKAIQQIYELPSRKAMTSGALKEVPDQSAFIEHLVKRLQTNQYNYLTAERLFTRLKENVISNSLNNQIPQYGDIIGAGSEGGDFIFIRRKN
ncbi:caspase family protein [Rhodocytophaga rosea]|uniref:Caspase family protein n=1 Tax=Rhodocytophaga rosea TaxID=2704465 RepID=A0A6C0GDI9_9BACT|nr:caspase family protein [Rhodocytophaga rosea]QHT65832.1 caspase family protein [Rhodocytophaga rosea]